MTTACVHHWWVEGCGLVQHQTCIKCHEERDVRPYVELPRFVHGHGRKQAPKPDETEEKTTS